MGSGDIKSGEVHTVSKANPEKKQMGGGHTIHQHAFMGG